jgi:hypothetical protein
MGKEVGAAPPPPASSYGTSFLRRERCRLEIDDISGNWTAFDEKRARVIADFRRNSKE